MLVEAYKRQKIQREFIKSTELSQSSLRRRAIKKDKLKIKKS
jgi:hypothetical protein